MTAKRKEPRILTVGPDINGLGGISVVLQTYRSAIPGFHYAATNSRHGSIAGAFVLLWLLVRLPFYKLAGFNIVHAQGASGKSFVRKNMVLRWARMLGFRTIYHCHGGGFRSYTQEKGSQKIASKLQHFNAIVALTPAWARFFKEEMACHKVVSVNNIVVPPVPECAQRSISAKIRFIFLGKICREKGLWDLIDALALLPEEVSAKVEIHICGTGENDALMEKARSLGVDHIITDHGAVYGKEKDALLRRCHLLILPSHTEGLPISLLEAGAYAMPAITTPVGGIPELIADGFNGTLVPVSSPQDIAKALACYVGNPGLISEQGRNARKAIEPYTPAVVNAQLQELYRTIL